jgi:pimeloyl-ACP methyl ester carboxylesterase
MSPAVSTSNTTPAEPARPATVVLIRGWRDLWSDGIDRLAEKLRSQGLSATVFRQSQSADVGNALLSGVSTDSPRRRIVLIGFSYGADDAITISRRLKSAGVAVDALLLIDPVTPDRVPDNVARCVNFYQSNGAWDLFPWLRGVAVEGESPAIRNVDLRVTPALLDPDTAHKTIAGSEKVHSAIIQEVRSTLHP